MKTIELVSILMESPFYFELALAERLHLRRYLARLCHRPAAAGGESHPAAPRSSRIHLGFFPPLHPVQTTPNHQMLTASLP